MAILKARENSSDTFTPVATMGVGNASQSQRGLMTAQDKVKVDSIGSAPSGETDTLWDKIDALSNNNKWKLLFDGTGENDISYPSTDDWTELLVVIKSKPNESSSVSSINIPKDAITGFENTPVFIGGGSNANYYFFTQINAYSGALRIAYVQDNSTTNLKNTAKVKVYYR